MSTIFSENATDLARLTSKLYLLHAGFAMVSYMTCDSLERAKKKARSDLLVSFFQLWIVAFILLLKLLSPVKCYIPFPCHSIINQGRPGYLTQLKVSNDAEVEKELKRARDLLEKIKAKLAAKEVFSKKADDSIPFFASRQFQRSIPSREGVVKHKDEKTGLITADGERMAKISEEEEWEMRPIYNVFDDETDASNRSNGPSVPVPSRDMAADIFNLRKQLQKGDYETIFDKRNIFIGEDN